MQEIDDFVRIKESAEFVKVKEFTFNSFVPNASFLYPLKTSENLTVFRCFHVLEKGCIGNEWVSESNQLRRTFFKHFAALIMLHNTARKVSKYGVFLVRIVNLRIQSNYGKTRTKITLYLDTFHTVLVNQ